MIGQTWTAQTLAGLGNLAPGFEPASHAHRHAETKIKAAQFIFKN
jgi:hypothetical protein